MNQSICMTDEDGTKQWTFNNLLHREDSPAIEYPDGHKSWYLHGQRHRINGPAIEWVNGDKAWFYHGKLIGCDSQEEFERLINLKSLW